MVVVSDEAHRVLLRRRAANNAAAILALLAGHREKLVGVVIESTYNWYRLVDALQVAGYRVHLANTAAIKRYKGLKHSGERQGRRLLDPLPRTGRPPQYGSQESQIPIGGGAGAFRCLHLANRLKLVPA